MRITIVSPLFPPDIAPPAPYVKELATRLSVSHSVSLLVYGALPETVPRVSFSTVPKRLPIPLRLFRFTFVLWRLSRQSDVTIIENGPSTEIPALMVGLLTRRKLFLDPSDHKVSYSKWLRRLHQFGARYIWTTLSLHYPPERPEILPFLPYPEAAFTVFESSWETYSTSLEAALTSPYEKK